MLLWGIDFIFWFELAPAVNVCLENVDIGAMGTLLTTLDLIIKNIVSTWIGWNTFTYKFCQSSSAFWSSLLDLVREMGDYLDNIAVYVVVITLPWEVRCQCGRVCATNLQWGVVTVSKIWVLGEAIIEHHIDVTPHVNIMSIDPALVLYPVLLRFQFGSTKGMHQKSA